MKNAMRKHREDKLQLPNAAQRRSKGVKTPIRKARILLSITAEFQLLCPAPHSSGSFAIFQRSFESPLPVIPEPQKHSTNDLIL